MHINLYCYNNKFLQLYNYTITITFVNLINILCNIKTHTHIHVRFC